MESDNNASSDLDQWQSLDEAGIDSIHRQLIWIWTQFFILTPLLASKRNEIKTTSLIYRVSVWGFIAGGIIYSPDRLPPAPGRSPPAPMQAAPNSVQQPNSNQMRPALSSDLIVVINVDDWLSIGCILGSQFPVWCRRSRMLSPLWWWFPKSWIILYVPYAEGSVRLCDAQGCLIYVGNSMMWCLYISFICFYQMCIMHYQIQDKSTLYQNEVGTLFCSRGFNFDSPPRICLLCSAFEEAGVQYLYLRGLFAFWSLTIQEIFIHWWVCISLFCPRHYLLRLVERRCS